MSSKKIIVLILIVVMILSAVCAAESSSPLSKNGYAARWLLEVDEPEISGPVNRNIEQSEFEKLYPDYSPLGDYRWLGEWIREGAWNPITIGDRLAHEGGAPFIITESALVGLYSDPEDGSATLEMYSRGMPIWVIGESDDWLLCVSDFSAWTYSDEPVQLICGWIPASTALPLPVGLWDGSSGEGIEASHLRVVCSEDTIMYSTVDLASDALCTIPKGSEIDAYYCSIDDSWYVCWYDDLWGYIQVGDSEVPR